MQEEKYHAIPAVLAYGLAVDGLRTSTDGLPTVVEGDDTEHKMDCFATASGKVTMEGDSNNIIYRLQTLLWHFPIQEH